MFANTSKARTNNSHNTAMIDMLRQPLGHLVENQDIVQEPDANENPEGGEGNSNGSSVKGSDVEEEGHHTVITHTASTVDMTKLNGKNNKTDNGQINVGAENSGDRVIEGGQNTASSERMQQLAQHFERNHGGRQNGHRHNRTQ